MKIPESVREAMIVVCHIAEIHLDDAVADEEYYKEVRIVQAWLSTAAPPQPAPVDKSDALDDAFARLLGDTPHARPQNP